MKITKKTIKRALRTFIQAFIGSAVATGGSMIWTDIDILKGLLAVLITSVFAGLSAIGMNLEKKEVE